MHPLFIACLGNRDLALDLGAPGAPALAALDRHHAPLVRAALVADGHGDLAVGTRPLAEALARDLDRYAPRIALPILGPALELALAQHGRIDELVLYATDQPASVSQRLWDTCASAALLERLLPTRYPDRIGRVVTRVVAGNPADYDDMRAAVVAHLRARRAADDTPSRRVVVSVRGGTPAMNTALLDGALGLWGPRVAAVLVREPAAAATPGASAQLGLASWSDTWPLRRDNVRRVLAALVDHHEYDGALRLLDAEEVADALLRALLAHAAARLNLDDAGAAAALAALPPDPLLERLRTGVGDLWSVARLDDLAATARVLLARGDHLGFVTRAATTCETARRLMVDAAFGLRAASEVDARDLPSGLVGHLRAKAWRETARGRWQASSGFYEQCLGWSRAASPDPAMRTRIGGFLAATRALRPWEEQRNASVHRAHGLSAQDVCAAVRARSLADARLHFDGTVARLRAAIAPGAAPAWDALDACARAALDRFDAHALAPSAG